LKNQYHELNEEERKEKIEIEMEKAIEVQKKLKDIGGVVPGSAIRLHEGFQDKDKNQLYLVTCFRQQATDYIKVMKK
jgi:hypothetical protein